MDALGAASTAGAAPSLCSLLTFAGTSAAGREYPQRKSQQARHKQEVAPRVWRPLSVLASPPSKHRSLLWAARHRNFKLPVGS
jgi:hypothetical protein